MEQIMNRIDLTLLSPTSTWDDIEKLIKLAEKYNAASICIPPSYVSRVRDVINDKVKICTVVGFPLGYSLSETKLLESQISVENGADELDMVINLSDLKNKDYRKIENEIKSIRYLTGDKILKVIIEACYLEDDEKIKMCDIIKNANADYVKTSTGFGTSGAKLEDIKLIKDYVGNSLKIKAAGGIRTHDQAVKFIECGADRIGTSSIIIPEI